MRAKLAKIQAKFDLIAVKAQTIKIILVPMIKIPINKYPKLVIRLFKPLEVRIVKDKLRKDYSGI